MRQHQHQLQPVKLSVLYSHISVFFAAAAAPGPLLLVEVSCRGGSRKRVVSPSANPVGADDLIIITLSRMYGAHVPSYQSPCRTVLAARPGPAALER